MRLHQLIIPSLVAVALSICSTATIASAQTTENSEHYIMQDRGSTSSTVGGRFEIIRDHESGRPCFRIDKYTGSVWKLAYSVGINAKYYVCAKEHSENDTVYDDTINYQLIVDSSTHAILMNLNTGELWEYQEGLTSAVSRFKLMTER